MKTTHLFIYLLWLIRASTKSILSAYFSNSVVCQWIAEKDRLRNQILLVRLASSFKWIVVDSDGQPLEYDWWGWYWAYGVSSWLHASKHFPELFARGIPTKLLSYAYVNLLNTVIPHYHKLILDHIASRMGQNILSYIYPLKAQGSYMRSNQPIHQAQWQKTPPTWKIQADARNWTLQRNQFCWKIAWKKWHKKRAVTNRTHFRHVCWDSCFR